MIKKERYEGGIWQMKLENNPRRDIIVKAKDTIENELWESTDMQKMSDSSSELIRKASEKGIPDGLLRNLRRDLHNFKGIWRGTRALESLARGPQ